MDGVYCHGMEHYHASSEIFFRIPGLLFGREEFPTLSEAYPSLDCFRFTYLAFNYTEGVFSRGGTLSSPPGLWFGIHGCFGSAAEIAALCLSLIHI